MPDKKPLALRRPDVLHYQQHHIFCHVDFAKES